ncbi:DNA-binding GntR family transcriptional regulator [Phyllobacterium trifolii]|uniref:DNA-binding GntR family transcriptional regulator n=1 Tax=Phyllobacterium trifolii TaxID=300193 RepID=A0A839UJ28_9HYPH|nr:GntR family transcriptional regulator [Phyllobacterium trifolii]MBB3148539.1 DNA-binding GntR family transcriptional regulator [Phyllobacterium trifolii]
MTTHSRRAYEEIRRLILVREIPSDEPISERGLSERLGLGRTPIREALKDLERDGLIEVSPRRGTFVRRLSLADLRDIYEVRMGLEGIAAFLAAARGPTSQLLSFEEKFEKLLDDPSSELLTIQKLGWDFHDAIYEAAGNRELLRLNTGLRNQIGLTMELPRHHDHDRVRATVAEHLKILRAIKAMDPEGAQRAIYQHLSNALSAGAQIFSKFE